MTRKLIATLCLFLVSTTHASGQLSAPEKASQTLPKVVLIGDSIRLSYASTVIGELNDRAVIVSPKPNGGDSSKVLKNLEAWVIREQPDVVHFNCGIHDTKKFLATGKFQISPEQYEANLREIVKRIRTATHATLVFATSTPIIDERALKARQGRDYELLNSSILNYNAIANKIMQDLNVPVNDLHALVAHPEPPETLATLLGSDGVHLTPQAQKLLGRRVARVIRGHLKQKKN